MNHTATSHLCGAAIRRNPPRATGLSPAVLVLQGSWQLPSICLAGPPMLPQHPVRACLITSGGRASQRTNELKPGPSPAIALLNGERYRPTVKSARDSDTGVYYCRPGKAQSDVRGTDWYPSAESLVGALRASADFLRPLVCACVSRPLGEQTRVLARSYETHVNLPASLISGYLAAACRHPMGEIAQLDATTFSTPASLALHMTASVTAVKVEDGGQYHSR